MARLARLVIPGLPHYVTQRGNRRQRNRSRPGDWLRFQPLAAEKCDYPRERLRPLTPAPSPIAAPGASARRGLPCLASGQKARRGIPPASNGGAATPRQQSPATVDAGLAPGKAASEAGTLETSPSRAHAAGQVLQPVTDGAEIARVLPQPLPWRFGKSSRLHQPDDLLAHVVGRVLPARRRVFLDVLGQRRYRLAQQCRPTATSTAG